jgi:hypothetical protein
MFLLQPMVRGWARYQGRLALQPMPEAALQRAQALEVQAASDPPRELYYWANQRSDRVEFLNGILRRLDLEGWPNRGDSGWSDYDIEIYGHRWSRLRLTLIFEDYADGKRLFRCRLRSTWSLPALVAFWAAFAVQLFALGVLARGRPWLWTVLFSMLVFGWYLRSQKRALQRVFAVFLDEMARHWKMTKLGFDPEKETFLPLQ